MLRRIALVLAIAGVLPSTVIAAQIPWQTPDVLLTFGNQLTTITIAGIVDTSTGLTSVLADSSSVGGIQDSGVIPDVSRTEEVLVSGTPGNPFDPPVYETRIVETHDLNWMSVYQATAQSLPINASRAVSQDFSVSIGINFMLYNTGVIDWGTEHRESPFLMGYGGIAVRVQFDSQGNYLDSILSSQFDRDCFQGGPAPDCSPVPNKFEFPVISGTQNSSGEIIQTTALPFAPQAAFVPEPSSALLMGLGLAALATSRPAGARGRPSL